MFKMILSMVLLCTSMQVHALVKFTTFNIRNFDSPKSPTDKVELKRLLIEIDSDFLVVEEILNTSSFTKFIKKEFNNKYAVHLSRCGGGGDQQIGFVFNKSKFKLEKVYEDNRLNNARITSPRTTGGCGSLRPAYVGIFTEIKTKKKFVAIGVHLKAGGRRSSYNRRSLQYRLLGNIVEELKQTGYDNIVIMGDFNTTGYIKQDNDYLNFKQMLQNSRLSSSAINVDCTSYWSGENRRDNIEEPAILDHVLYPGKFLDYGVQKVELHSHCKKVSCTAVSGRTLGTTYLSVSDHCPVSITFN